ncbi:hypothetical protein Tco_0938335 [Tanacetum coccineum]|uniref:Reverse transcriptase domain-containing protein n=1 Tax=Tanacetum coccineum TaxID=301880 RepID=A0ABQ5DHI5_9ASTR
MSFACGARYGLRVWRSSLTAKSYADLKRVKPMEFEVGDKVMLKVSPWKGVVVRLANRGKFKSQGCGPFKRGPEFTWERGKIIPEEIPHMFSKDGSRQVLRLKP